MRRALTLTVIVAAGLAAIVADAYAQDCVTRWNSLLRQYETRCADGSSATERYNNLLRQWDQTISLRPHPCRCTTRP